MKHELHAFEQVDRPYAEVRDRMFAGPLALFHDATSAAPTRGDSPGSVELRAKAGPFTVGHEVVVDVVGIEDGRRPDGRPGERFLVQWRAARRPGLFPALRASLTIYPLADGETQLALEGTYDPPLGWIGDAIDAIAMHRVAQESVAGFVRDVAAYLRTPSAA